MAPCAERFNRIAQGYDRLNRILSWGLDVGWRRRALTTLHRLQPNVSRVLDLATGTADFALTAASFFPTARITGVDFSRDMLALAREKTRRAGCQDRVTFQAGDAAALPCADACFDVVLCGFGFRNFPRRREALREVARVLAPGGTAVVLEFFRPTNRLTGWLTDAWLGLAARLWARDIVDDYDYLRRSIERMETEDAFVAQAQEVGLTCVERAFFHPACSCLLFRPAARS